MNIAEDQDISAEDWDELILRSPYSSAFQTREFYKIFNKIPGMSARIYGLKAPELKALCVVTFQKGRGIASFFSRRAIIYGGPVIHDVNEKQFEFFISGIKEKLRRKVIYTEIRNCNSYSNFYNVYSRNRWKYLPYQNYIVDCSDKNTLLSRMSSGRRRQIRKAIDSGVSFRKPVSVEEVRDFFRILQKLYRRKIGKPLPAWQFFEEFYFANTGIYLLVFYREKIIGGIMCPILEGRCIYELYVSGLDEEYNSQFPGVMATWAALSYANENGIPLFDFMGAGMKNKNYGVREFKSRFGGNLVEYGRFISVHNIFLYSLGKMIIGLIGRLKK